MIIIIIIMIYLRWYNKLQAAFRRKLLIMDRQHIIMCPIYDTVNIDIYTDIVLCAVCVSVCIPFIDE